MKLIVGLGNPGSQYTKTRHNAGFMVVERLHAAFAKSELPKARFKSLAIEATIGSERCLLLKPNTYMNLSGQAVAEAIGFYKVSPQDDLLVVVDDLYLPTGKCRLLGSGGAGGHNGLIDIERALSTDAYPRLRVGVGIQPSGGKPAMMNQADFVLSRFTSDEDPLLLASITKAASGVEAWVTKGLAQAMNVTNANSAEERPKAPSPKPPSAQAPAPNSSAASASTSASNSLPRTAPGAPAPLN
jgi:PTH1 family peptidyl-tRNA hydrolase